MKLTVLMENNTLIGKYLRGEAAFSLLLEDQGQRILFDTGYTNTFLENASCMGIDMLHLDWIVLSHGHSDHTWGLDGLIRQYMDAVVFKRPYSRPRLLAHPGVFTPKVEPPRQEIGMLMDQEKLDRQFPTTLSDTPFALTDNLHFLGEIPRIFDFEQGDAIGDRLEPDGPIPDYMPEDSGLALVTDSGLVVISGCAHSGICAIVEHARKVTGVDCVRSVFGGFHLLDAPEERLEKTADYFASLNLETLYPCHCTDLAAKIALARKNPVLEVGVGMQLTFA
ncbi:MBL fold metallo-hydrolase [Pseudodesulfovibrio tunisiensis]|uniref:MBL fold metallo-hydrolase n=1 Tax=Pseudodesulfovibrio tunisiensis TaxID=463192 RepID=UPI001FB4C0BD|nr:MBL fold metallo-hydrolase [Pseudodesulfovibrio tunisiensis]